MSKKYLALTALAAAMGVSPFAAANITSTALNYADENDLGSNTNGTPANVLASGAGQVLRVEGTLNTSISSGDTKYIRFDFGPDAEIFTPPATGGQLGGGALSGTLQLPSPNCLPVAPPRSTTLVNNFGSNYVVFQVESKCGFDNTQPWSFELEDIFLDVQIPQTITYSVYETNTGANNEDPAQLITTDTAPWFGFATACNVECGVGPDIDRARIATDARFWAGDDPQAPIPPAELAVFRATGFVTANTHRADGAPVNFFDDCYIQGNMQAAILGSMDSFRQEGPGFSTLGPNPVWRIGAGDLAPEAYDLAGEGAFFWPPAAPVDPAGYTADVVFQPTGLLFATRPQMRPSNYELVLSTQRTGQPVAPTPYFGNRSDTEMCGTIAYSGSTDELVFGQTPQSQGGLYRQLIRITNPASLEADVMVTVYNDAGDRADFNLSELTGESVLGAQSSTPLFSIDAFYDAAVAADPSFGLTDPQGPGNRDKLRIVVRSSAGNDALDGSSILDGQGGTPLAGRAADGVSIQAFLISRDNNAFLQNK